MPKKILVCVDMGQMAEHLVEYGHSLAHRLDAEVSFLHVLPSAHTWVGYGTWVQPDITKEAQESARKKIEYFIRKAEEKHPELSEHEEHPILFGQGDSAKVIIETGKKDGFNLIVIGFKGGGGIEKMMIGSTTTNVSRYANCSVLIYRPGFDPF
ncbi:MAG: universal stress protein [Thermovirgaceae bacterium]|nr:universal stress protein [Thermovirgaceae bacterium]